MTVASTATFELSVDQIVRRAMQVAGLLASAQSPGSDDLSLAHDLMNMELDALQAEGLVVRTVERTTQALVAGTAEYTLATDTSDVVVPVDGVAGTIVPSSGAETLVRQIKRHEYIEISNKATQGVPTQVFIERAGTVKLVFWPVPSAASSFRYARVRIPKDTTNGSTTAEVERRRQKAIVWSLAYDLAVAKSLPQQRVTELRNERDRLKFLAKADDSERGQGQFYIAHGGWY